MSASATDELDPSFDASPQDSEATKMRKAPVLTMHLVILTIVMSTLFSSTNSLRTSSQGEFGDPPSPLYFGDESWSE